VTDLNFLGLLFESLVIRDLRVDAAKSGSAACLGVIVANGYGFVHDDGIAVIPIGALARSF